MYCIVLINRQRKSDVTYILSLTAALQSGNLLYMILKFEDTIGAIRFRQRDRHHIDQKKKTNNNLQNTTLKTKD